MHLDFQGFKGTGVTTGSEYVSQQTTNFTFNFPASTLGSEQTITVMFNLIGQGQAPNEVLKGTFHVTVDASGNVTSFVDDFRVKCS
jgi:hypothetical protein